MRRYWSLPLEGCVRFARPQDYVEGFRSRFEAAVADRLRTDRAVIFLSGGPSHFETALSLTNHVNMGFEAQAVRGVVVSA